MEFFASIKLRLLRMVRGNVGGLATQGRMVAAAAAVVALTTVFSTAYFVIANHHPIPIIDHWVVLDYYRDFLDGTLSLSDLWSLHNEHRPLIGRLLLLADLAWDSGSGRFLVVLLLLIQAAQAVVLTQGLFPERKFSGSVRILFLSIALVFCFWLRQKENFSWTFNIVWMINLLAVSVAAWSCARARTESGETDPWAIVLAGFCCLVAVCTLASGVFLAPLLLVVLWKGGVSRSVLIGWSLFMVLIAVGYLIGYHPVQLVDVPDRPLGPRVLAYLLVFLGAPISGFGWRLLAGSLVGTLALASFLWLSWRFLRSRHPSQAAKFSFVVMGSTVLTAGASAIGRNGYDLTQATQERYLTVVLLFWFCLVALLYRSRIFRRLGDGRIHFGLLCALVFLFLPVHFKNGLIMRQHYFVVRDEASLALASGVWDPSTIGTVFMESTNGLDGNGFLKERGLSFYADPWLRLIDHPLPPDTLKMRGIVGATLIERTILGSLPEGRHISGILPVRGDGRDPDLIVVVRNDTVAGFAGLARRDCAGCFSGYVKGDGDYRLFGRTPDGYLRPIETLQKRRSAF